ncbi:MAG: sugar porter family MFS transporter [Verrucomicrobiae bacterium]|nr:sugar porter family MFS transporter [Verrucomicrobiae bacterium]
MSTDAGANPPPGARDPFRGNLYLAAICLVAAIGGLLFGFDTAVVSGAVGFFRAEFGLSASMTGWAASSALVGCMLGAAIAGALSDRFGRKRILLLSAIFFTASAIGCGLARDARDLVLWRIVGGMGIGVASMLSPLYIAEVAPPHLRGRLVSLQQFAIISGILAAYFSNAFILHTGLGDAAKWRWMFAVGAVPAAAFFALLLPVPESPRWLLKQGLAERAAAILARVSGGQDPSDQIAQIRDAIAHEGGSLRELLQPGLRLAMLVGVVLAVLQQVTGINAILYYAPEIFKGAGAAASSAFNDTVWIGVFNLLFTIVAMMSIDRIGRKPLLLSGAVGMGVSLLLLARAFDARASGPGLLVVILAYVSFFAASLGPVVWVVMSEIFPTRIRGRAMSLATVSLWAACFLVSQTFPVLIDAAGGATAFRIYAAFCAVTALFVALAVPETRGKSLEEIERTWHRPLARH